MPFRPLREELEENQTFFKISLDIFKLLNIIQ